MDTWRNTLGELGFATFRAMYERLQPAAANQQGHATVRLMTEYGPVGDYAMLGEMPAVTTAFFCAVACGAALEVAREKGLI